MNILIVGEFSAFAKHLKNGFEKLGHRVVITTTGDKGVVATGEDIPYEKKTISIGGKLIPGSTHIFAPKVNLHIQKELNNRFPNGVDLVFVVHYAFLSSNIFEIGVSLKYLNKQLAHGAKLIMSVCGGDPANHYTFASLYKEWGMSASILHDKRYTYLLNKADVIIPTTYSYYQAIHNFANYESFDSSKIHHAFPIPMTVDEDCIINSCNGRKIIVFHGLNQIGMKGTRYIQPAMERIQNEFPDKVECICKGGLPYDEYVKLFDKVDILIDQASLNGWGVNAAIGAMKGKCVLVSCGKENGDNMGIDNIPFVEISRDTENIYLILKDLVLNPEKIDKIKIASRKFMERYCDCKIVAKQYLESVGLS